MIPFAAYLEKTGQRLDRRIFVDEDFAAVEFVPDGANGLCRIIGTTLSNYAMPFHFYGKIVPEFRTAFDEAVEKLPNVHYHGVFTGDSEAAYKELNQYDVLLLPTKCPTEGLPGILIEAKIAGLVPVISGINYTHETVKHGVDGIVLERDTGECLASALEALAGDGAQLLVLGKGEEEANLKALAEELGIRSRVEFVGYVSNVEDYLLGSDVFLLSSQYEAQPLSILEAMAAGLPVIATDVGSVSDLVDGNGILIPANDAEVMAQAMEQLYLQPRLREEMTARATEMVQRYDLSNTVAGYARLYCDYFS